MTDHIDVNALAGMKYVELRALAKKHGIRANMKSEKLLKALQEFALASQKAASDHEYDEETSAPSPAKQAPPKKPIRLRKRKSSSPSEAPSKCTRGSSPKVVNAQLPTTPEDAKDTRRSTFDVPKEKSRRNTFEIKRESTSPGVKDMIDAMEGDMTDDERKNCLMAALDRKVDSTKKVTVEKTGIPRFTALMPKQVRNPITPGNKDWRSIHQRNFDKMESLGEYMARKRRRSSSVARSVKTKTQGLREAVDNLSKQNSSAVKERRQVNARAKVKRLSSAANKPFKPSVTSTSKISTNFKSLLKKKLIASTTRSSTAAAMKKTPKPSTPKVRASAVKTPQVINNTGVSESNENQAAKVSSAMKVKSTPFQFKASQPLNLSVTTVEKSKFDIQSSLKKKPSYRMHKGSLKPFVQQNIYAHETYVKEVPVETRSEKRRKANNLRADRRKLDLMKRRGLAE